jgi:hypothetical protein
MAKKRDEHLFLNKRQAIIPRVIVRALIDFSLLRQTKKSRGASNAGAGWTAM